MIELRGIAWNHTRGFTPVVATAQRFEELHPDVRITFEKRSLQAFADASVADLAADYDLIVMDHPHTALAATGQLLLPFDDFAPDGYLDDQAKSSVGGSHASYRFEGKQWTLASDAAAPIATWRPDLMAKFGLALPETWDDVLEMARAGHVTVSAFPVDVLMLTYSFCDAFGESPFANGNLASAEVLADALAEIRKLVELCDPECLRRNPIRTAEWMSSQFEDPRGCYCPFAYGYSNYSRPGFARYALGAGNPVSFGSKPLRTTLGGAGIAVSAGTAHPREAMDYALFTASPEVQCGLYFEAGGQPGHRAAWTSDAVNAASNQFFRDTLPALDRALLRPQLPDYMTFQDTATPVAHDAVSGKLEPAEAAGQMLRLWDAKAGSSPQ